VVADGLSQCDITLLNSVVAYLPDLGSVERLLELFGRTAERIAILDIPDARLMLEREAGRVASMPRGDYRRRYLDAGLKHLYIDVEWFTEKAMANGFEVRISPQNIPGFRQSAYHFNAYLNR
jgi:hypothetical protein